MRHVLIAGLLALLASTAFATEPIPIHDGDRVTGTFPAELTEVGLVLDGLEGSVLTVKVKATGDSVLAPEILLFDPEDVVVSIGPALRTNSSATKATLRRFTLPVTGRYTIVLRAATGTSGAYKLKLRAEHPTRFKSEGSVSVPDAEAHLRFPAFAGSTAKTKVKGRDGLVPDASSLLRPDVATETLAAILDGTTSRCGSIALAELGDYRLVVTGLDGTTGRYKAKVRLKHPTEKSRSLVADGQAAGTFTGSMFSSVPGQNPGTIPEPEVYDHRWLCSGITSQYAGPATVVARTPTEFANLLGKVTLDPYYSVSDLYQAVDFDEEIVVGIFIGTRPTTGYQIGIDWLEKSGSYILVKWYHTYPNPTCPQEIKQVTTQPWILIRVTPVNRPVKFEFIGTFVNGCHFL